MNTLREELGAHIECIGVAQAIHEEQLATAGIARSGRVLAAETLLAESLLKIQQRERK